MKHPGSAPPPNQPITAAQLRAGDLYELCEGAPGWTAEAPSLAVEYADGRRSEAELQQRIAALVAAGTRWVWVVRLREPRHVEVVAAPSLHPVRVMGPGEVLEAPGILKNPIPVEALYNREAAHETTLRNLLQRKGYEGLDAVREEGRAEGLRSAVRDVCELLGIALPPAREASLQTMGVLDLCLVRARLKRTHRWP